MFATVFLGLGLGMWRGPRLLQGLSRRRLFGVSLTLAGLLLVPLAMLNSLETATGLTIVIGFFAGVAWVTGNTMLGLEVPDELRGRTFAFVGSLIRLALALVLALGPLVAGFIGTHMVPVPNSDHVLTYNGAAWTLLGAGVLMTVVGLASYRQMDDRKGISLVSDLRRAAVSSPGVYTARGLFVAFEGGEGAGKSTQARLLLGWLTEEGYDVLLTHEPGDTEVGKKVRADRARPGHRRARRPHRGAALRRRQGRARRDASSLPALARGAVVVTDRYVDSTLAYQGAGRAIPDDELERVARWATGDLRPHLTVLLDLPTRRRPDPVRDPRPDRGRVAGVPRARPRGVPALAVGRPRALPRRRRHPAADRDRRPDPAPARAPARPGRPPRTGSRSSMTSVWSTWSARRGGGRALQRAVARRHDPCLAVHRPAGLGPLQRGDRLRGRAAVRARRAAASATPATTVADRLPPGVW